MIRRAPLRWYLRFGDPRKVKGGVSVVHDPEAYAYAEEPALYAFEPGDTPPRLRSEAGISAYDVLAHDGERIVFHIPVGLWTFSGQMENFLEKRIMADDVWLFRGRAKAAWGTDGEPLVDASTVRDVQRVGTKHLWATERRDHTTPSASWKRMLDLFDARELERLHDMGYDEFFHKKPKDVSRKEITDYIGALRLRFTTPQQQRALDEVETLWLRQWDEDHRATARTNPRRRNPRNPQTDTPAFKRWFGDSKVVDARGEPLVVYHGSPEATFSVFRATVSDQPKIMFSGSREIAETYTGRGGSKRGVYAAYLRMERPLVVDARGANWDNIPLTRTRTTRYQLRKYGIRGPTSVDALAYLARNLGYDGLIVEDVVDVYADNAEGISNPRDTTYVVFDPRQIKSATGNRGTFAPADPDIRHNPRRPATSAMRTDPELWEEVKAEVTRGSKGGLPGQWSARKAQLAVALYKQRGGDYYGPKSPYNALAKWTREDWRTKSGRPSLETGERYLPAAAIAALTPAEYAATTKAKRAGMKKGQQFVPQPEKISMKVSRYRRNPSYDDMRFSRGVLQTPEGPIKLKKIGKGAFSTAYVEVREDAPAEGRAGPAGGRAGPKPRVFVFSGSEVVDKELLAMALDAAPNNPHLPKVERFGNVGDMNVYVMPLYNSPFRKGDSPQGWKDFSAIKKCREQAWRDISQRGTTYREEYAPPIGGIFAGGIRRVGRPPDMTHRGYDVNLATVECAKASGVRPAVVGALEVLTDTASNYGASQVFEFAPRNLATDDAGNLIFLDPLFDMEQLERQRAEARRRAAAASRMRGNPRRPVAGRRPPRIRNPQIDIQPLEDVSQEDISNAVRAYRPVEGRSHQARIRKAKEILRRRGYALTGPALGAGTMATVFALEEYPDYVAKLTYDPTDAALMAEMAQIERKMEAAGKPMPAGLPRVVTVASLGPEDDPLGLYLVVVERLAPLNAEQKKRVSSLAKKLSWGSLAGTSIGNELWEVWKSQKKSPEYALLNAAGTIHALGYTPYDLDAQNTMQRADGTIVVSDFGYSAPRRGTRTRTVARLRNPARGV